MDGPILDAQELEAIRNAIRAAGRSPMPTPDPTSDSAVPIALIADDRAAERVRPTGGKLGNRWAVAARQRVLRLIGIKLGFDLASVEILEGSSFREDLPTTWTAALEPAGRPGAALVAIGGPMVESLAGVLLGAGLEDSGLADGRPPSPTSMKLFAPLGEVIAASLADVWREEQGCRVAVKTEDAKVDAVARQLADLDLVVAVTVLVGGPTRGTVRLLARPETLVMPATPIEAVPAPPGAIEEALGQVPIEVRVNLGHARLTMSEFSSMVAGSIIPLDNFVDDPLPVFCGGVVKATGRAIVSRGVLAVELGAIEGSAR